MREAAPQVLGAVVWRFGDFADSEDAVQEALIEGPAAGLALLESLEKPLSGHDRLHAVRAHLLEMTGEGAAITQYEPRRAGRPAYRAALLTTQAARLGDVGPEPSPKHMAGAGRRLTRTDFSA
jgi:predicted RNA polymerase sigma factor